MRTDLFTRDASRLLLAGVLGTWLGIQAIRGTFNLVVWNVAENHAPGVMAAVAGAIWIVGILGWLPARALGPARAGPVFALVLGVATVLRGSVAHGQATPYLSFLAFVAWAWWMPCWLRATASDPRVAVSAIVLGVVVQLAAHTALHGLDLHVLIGWEPALAALIAASTLLWATMADRRAEPRLVGASAWGAFALGPFLSLQLTLLANPGRLAVASGYELPYTVISAQAGLLSGVLAAGFLRCRAVRVAAAAALFLLAATFDRAGVALPVVIALAQCAAVLLLACAFAAAPIAGSQRTYSLFAAGQVAFFLLIFLFYARTDWPGAWLAGAALLAAAGLVPRIAEAPLPRLAIFAGGAAVTAGLLIALIPPGIQVAAPARGEIGVLSYNIHQALDARSVPSIREIAGVIERSGADVVMLQEINRGQTISGGADHAAWFAWRLPQYRVLFGPMQGSLAGNAILSRYPVTATGWERFPRVFVWPRGFAWAMLDVNGTELLVVSTHLASTQRDGAAAARKEQAQHLLQFIGARRRTIVGGSFNDTPDSPALVRAAAGGMTDVAAALGQADAPTHPAESPRHRLAYILFGPGIRALEHTVLPTLASDNRPVLARIAIER
jgi:endonuclease/exonuclease/phosphatase family metal-dependent hydrolase